MAQVRTGYALRPILKTQDTDGLASMPDKGLLECSPYTWPQLKKETYDAE